MIMTRFPCKDCENRKPGCHSVCEQYLTVLKEHQKKKDFIYAKKKINRDMAGYYRALDKSIKGRRKEQ